MRSGGSAVETPVFAGFLLVGVLTVLVGPLISELLARAVLSQDQAALLFPAQFAASSVGSVLSGFHLRRSLSAGYLAAAAGLAVLALLSWPLLLLGTALLGFGLGLLIPATNLLVAQRHPLRRGIALASLNLVWSLGAVGSPLLFAAVAQGVPLRVLLGLLSLLAAISCAAIAASSRHWPLPAPMAGEPPAAVLRFATLLALAAMLFLYVGSENAVGGWLVTLSDRMGDRSAVSLLLGSGFWAALLVGRAVTPLLLRAVSEAALFRFALALAGAGILLVVLAGSRPVLAAGALAAGLGLAPLFPLTVSRIAAESAGRGGGRSGWVFVGSGLGGASLPWLTARVGAGASDLQHGFVVPLAALGLLALLSLRRPAATPAPPG